MRLRVLLLSVALVAAGGLMIDPNPAAADGGISYTWTGQGTDSQNWNEAANWSPAGIPGSGDSVSISPPDPSRCYANVHNAPSVTLVDLTVSMDGPCDGNTYLYGGTLSVSGDFTWHGGQINNPLHLLGGSTGTISPGSRASSAADDLNSIIDVNGTLTMNNDHVYSGDGVDKSVVFNGQGHTNSVLSNALIIESDGKLITTGTNDIDALSCCIDPSRIVNHGLIEDSGLLRLDNAVLDQDGTVHTDSSSAEVDALAGNSDDPTLANTSADGATYSGPGTFRVTYASADATLTGTQHIGAGFRFVLGGGTDENGNQPDGNEALDGTFTLRGGGTFLWLGGHLSGNATISTSTARIGTTGIAGSGGNNGTPAENTYISGHDNDRPSTVTITGSTSFARGADATTFATTEVQDQSTLNLDGPTSLPADVRFYGGRIDNHGDLTLAAGGAAHRSYVTGSAHFTNYGTVHLKSGVLETDNDYRQITGSTDLAAAGHIRIDGSSSVVRLSGGQLSGTSTVYGNVVNSGALLSPGGNGTGTLTIDGSYTQGKNGRQVVDLTAHSRDVLAVHGTVSDKGRLTVRNHYTPHAGERRPILTASTRPDAHLSCVVTSGTASTGRHARHWAVSTPGHSVVITSEPGTHTHC